MKEFKLPKKVRVGGIIYDIEHFLFSEHSRNDGLCITTASKIKINKMSYYHNQYTTYVYLHELFHAIDHTYLGNVLEEDTVIMLTKGWLNFIVSNKFDFNKYVVSKNINICGVKYKVILENLNLQTTDISRIIVDTDVKEQRLSLDTSFMSDNESISNQRLIIAFLQGVSNIIAIEYNIADNFDFCDIESNVFANAVYQVIKDNKVDQLIRSVV